MRLICARLALIALASFAVSAAAASPLEQRGKPPNPSAAPTHPATTPHHAPVPVPQKIAGNPALVARLQPLLPSGMTVESAASGFKNEGQFIAALHVSHNLNIPFAQLKAEMTGSDHDSLGQAIHALQPTTDAKAAVKSAEQEARADIKAANAQKSDTDRDR